MRILTVANHLGARGGLERTQLTNCRALAARGHRVDLLYVSAGDFADEWRAFAGTMVQTPGTLPRRRRPLGSAAAVARAVAAGRRLRPDVLYVYRYWDLPYAAAVRGVAGVPVVYHLCLPPPVSVPGWLELSLRRVDRTLSVSRDTAARWEATGLGSARTEVVLTGIDLDRYVPADPRGRAAARAGLGLGADDVLVLYAGRIGREKGVDVLVRAFAAVHGAEPAARLVVVGSPSLGADPADSARYEAELRASAGTLPVTFAPAQHDVVPLLQSADVAVVPSLWPEPLSRSLMEPLACGVPVVATDVGGNPEILRGWLAPNLVPAGDPEALAARVLAVARWRRDQPDLGRRCRDEAEARLSLRAETDAIEAAMAALGPLPQPRRWRQASASEATSWG
ncbi:MAG TPA: glycosyltransferase family 4 protein [Acidimicrobiales bacterium]|nr:glycosyltransferase family 4 protein [Acidimicrobiales bacterium]